MLGVAPGPSIPHLDPVAPQMAHGSQPEFRLVQADSPEMRDLRRIFEEILVPLYGSQEDALSKIASAKDRICHLLYEIIQPVGVIAFKTILSNEFEEHGIRDSIEIKSLFVVDPEKNSGRGIGSTLLDKVIKETHRLGILYASLHVTVSEKKQDSLIFFKKKGFRIIHQWDGKYTESTKEYLLSRVSDLSKESQEKLEMNQDTLRRYDEVLQRQVTTIKTKLRCVLAGAHWDDIHALKKLSDDTFVSGSKDNTIRKWDRSGEVVREVLDVEPAEQYERNWITAMATLNHDYWVSADRSGIVRLWNTQGDFIKNLYLKRPGHEHVSLRENKHRVNCLVPGLDKSKPSFFAGFPTMFCEYNLIEGRTISTTQVHRNDWVYAIHPLNETTNLIAVAGSLEVWTKVREQWKYSSTLFKEVRLPRPASRRHIAALTPLQSSPSHFGMGIFGGFVNVIDVESKQVIREWKEHTGRVWAIENISQEIFASSGEDGFIKVWDTRQKSSVRSIGPHGGEVCALMQLDDHLLVAGASPEDAIRSNEGAQILFYDFRN